MKKTAVAISGIVTFSMVVFWVAVSMFASDSWITEAAAPLLYINIAVLFVELFIADHGFGLSFNKVNEADHGVSTEVNMIVYGSVLLNFALTLIWYIVRHMFYYSNPGLYNDVIGMREFYIPAIALADHIFAVGHYAVFGYFNNKPKAKTHARKHKRKR